MSIQLTWTDTNTSVDGYRVYRSTSAIDSGALPTPLATVAAGTLTYTDTTALRNTVYHYRIGAYKGTEENVSPDRIMCYMPYTGPGPSMIIRGTWENGYFGRMLATDLFDATQLCNTLGIAPTNITPNSYWLKFVYKGKILYFPEISIANTIALSAIYQAGAMYGNEAQSGWSTYMTSTFGVITQGKVIQRGEDAFVVRLPKSRAVLGDTSAVNPDSFRTGEYDMCFMAAFIGTNYGYPATGSPPTLDDLVNDNKFNFAMDQAGALATNLYVSRGTTANTSGDLVTLTATATVSNSGLGYRPVLELVM